MTRQQRHTDLFMIRHGQTESNIRNLLHGSTDVPLTETGMQQAELIATRMSQTPDLDSLYASPLQRARHTAEAIGRQTNLTPVLHEGLAEMHFGDAEGASIDELEALYVDEYQRFLNFDDFTIRFPGGESRGEFLERIQTTLDEIATEHTGQRVVVVAHGGVIAAAIGLIMKEQPGDWRRYGIKNCSLTHIELATSGPVTHMINDVVHLEQIDLAPSGSGSEQ